MTAQPAPAFTLSAELPVSELTDEQFMTELRNELKRASSLTATGIADYTQDRQAWLEYKADGYSQREAVEADMEYWD